MCVGSMRNGDPLPIYSRFNATGAAAAPILLGWPITVAAGDPIPIVHTFVTSQIGGKLHNCPSCHCISVQP